MYALGVQLFISLLLVPFIGQSYKFYNPPHCRSFVYCAGDMLEYIQTSSIFADSKTFVDMPLKENKTTIVKSFYKLMQITEFQPTTLQLKEFIDTYFDPPESEFEPWAPKDWVDKPAFINKIRDERYKRWAMELNSRWLSLFRKVKEDVKDKEDQYSSIYLPNPFIIPGGRYREQHYWQSYWIVKSLLVSGMNDTVKGILNNFFHLFKKFGKIPAGSRVYYQQRTQLPLLIPMVDMYVKATNDEAFLKKNLHILEKEFSFWLYHRTTGFAKNGRIHRIGFYRTANSGPRPEEYKIDMEATKHLDNEISKNHYFSQARAVTESGWQMSSRWYLNPNVTKENWRLEVSNIIPVDLNSVMCWNAHLLTKFNAKLNRSKKALSYSTITDEFVEMIEQISWNEDVGMWLDKNWRSSRPRNIFYISNISPLWTGCYRKSKKDYYIRRVLDYMFAHDVIPFKGIPASEVKSGEIWDFPNMIAPLQHMVITALKDSNNGRAKRIAYYLARNMIETTYKFYKKKNSLLDFYDVRKVGKSGPGGNYLPQEGFGWTNAVVLDILNMYGDDLH